MERQIQQIKVAKKERTPETKLPASLETLLTESFQNAKEKPNLSGEPLFIQIPLWNPYLLSYLNSDKNRKKGENS